MTSANQHNPTRPTRGRGARWPPTMLSLVRALPDPRLSSARSWSTWKVSMARRHKRSAKGTGAPMSPEGKQTNARAIMGPLSLQQFPRMRPSHQSKSFPAHPHSVAAMRDPNWALARKSNKTLLFYYYTNWRAQMERDKHDIRSRLRNELIKEGI